MDPCLYYVQTIPGIEKIAWLEIRRRLPHARFVEELFAKEKNGIVVFEFSGNPGDLLALRTVEDVFILVASLDKLSRDWEDLRVTTQLLQESSALDHAAGMVLESSNRGRPITYRVISRKEGKHAYRRKDLEEAVYRGIEHRYQGRWVRVRDRADLEIWANVLGSRLLCGLRLSDRTMRHREYQVVNLPASLRPSVAAAMVFLTEPGPDDVFVDPMCGSGTILAERLEAGPCRAALGGDISRESVSASRQNLERLARPCTVFQWDARRMPLAAHSVDKVAVNLPFGKKIGPPTLVRELYPPFFSELERVLKPGGRAAILSSEYELIKEVVRQHQGLQVERGYSIAVLGQWGRVYLVNRL